jgi:hypothetical protein
MVFLHINKSNHLNLVPKLNKAITRPKTHVFILYHMQGCMPCLQTIPEWKKIQNVLTNTNSIIVIDIDKDYTAGIKNIGSPLNGFPTIRYMTNQGAVIENYEDSNIATKDRTIDSFMEWIKSKTGNKPKMIASRKIRRRTRNNKKFNKQIKSRKHR